MTQEIFAYHRDLPASPKDNECRAIFDKHGGKFVGAGTALAGVDAGVRDVQYRFDDDFDTAPLQAELVEAGFKLKLGAPVPSATDA